MNATSAHHGAIAAVNDLGGAMQGFVNLLRGSVCIRVMGAFPERFLNPAPSGGWAFGAEGWTANTFA
jgi:hypothetical protein